MKKTLAILLALAMVFSTVTFAFAEGTIGTDAQSCVTLGMLKGATSAGVTADYLATPPTRIQAALLFLRLKGLEPAALAFTGTDNFVDADQQAWAKPVMAYLKANPQLGFQGIGNDKFDPNGLMNASSYYKVVLTALGYKQTTTDVVGDFLYADVLKFAAEKGLKNVAAVTNFTVNDLAIATIEGLKATVNGTTKTLAASLIEANAITEKQATDAGVYTVPAPTVAKIDSAVALSSNVIAVTLDEATTAANAAMFTVVDKDAKAVAVSAAEFAPWDTDKTEVLLTLGTKTVAGTLYTVKSGDTKANFGGIAAETNKPTATVASTDYNEVTVTFNEPVDARTLAFSAAEKYGSKAALNVTLKEIKSSTQVVFTSDAQKSATLYSTVITGVKDFAGNAMDKDESQTFVGQAMPTTKQGLNTVTVVDSKTIVVGFDVKVDQTAALNPANYVITEKYGSKATIAVTAAAMNLDANDDVLPKEVKLTLGTDTKSGTLYGLEVKNVGTLYGYALDTDDDTTTFVGKDKDTDEPDTVAVTSDSNTQITVSFSDPNGADNLAADVDYTLVSVKEKYGAKAALALTFKKVDDNTIVFTTASQKAATLYEVTVAKGIKDALGNVTTDELTTTFVGSGVAAKISSILAITDNTATTGKIRVQFNKNYGDGGLDVASYYIDGGVGYPSKVSAVTSNPDKVDLTIGKTVTGKLYKLTVKGVANADGVAMDADGISKNFVGVGGAAVSAPKLEAAVAINNQTAKLYFDTDVEDIDGLVNSNGTIPAGAIQFGTATNPATNLNYGFVDPDNSKVLVVYSTTDNAFSAGNANDLFYVNVDGVAGMDTDNDEVTMAENATEPDDIAIDGVVATSTNTLTVYFNQPVRHLGFNDNTVATDEFAFVDMDGNGTYLDGTDAEITNARALNDYNTAWEVMINKPLANQQYNLVVNTGAGNTVIATIASGATLKGLDTDTTSIAFAGNTSATAYIDDVYAVMTDARTVVVYYPEDMNESEVENVGNYNFGTSTANVILSTYDATAKTATLIVDADMTVNQDTLIITANTIHNAIGNRVVETDDATPANLTVAFAKSTVTPAMVAVKGITVSGDVMTITFTQRFKSDSNLTTTTAKVLEALDITVNNSTAVAAADIVGGVTTKLGTSGVADSSANYIDTIVIDFSAVGNITLTPNAQADVSFDDPVTENFTGIKGQIQDVDAAAFVSVQ